MRHLVVTMAAIAAVAAAPAVWAQAPPRAEFPQPQFEREQWLTLNGAWEFEFDDANAGVNERWQAGGRAFTKKITVPYAFEAKLSGIGDTGFHPWVWYRRAVALPAGLAFAVASDRFLARALTIDDRGLYLDAVALHHAADDGRFPQTPALPIVHALDRQLERILEGDLAARFDRHRVMRERVEHWVRHRSDVSMLAPVGRRADTVSAIRLPAGHSAAAVIGRLAHAGYQVAAGLDVDLDQVIRIGHMGEAGIDQLDHLLATLDASI